MRKFWNGYVQIAVIVIIYVPRIALQETEFCQIK